MVYWNGIFLHIMVTGWNVWQTQIITVHVPEQHGTMKVWFPLMVSTTISGPRTMVARSPGSSAINLYTAGHWYLQINSVCTYWFTGVIGSDVPWLDCPASNAIAWVITVTE